ncbi:MAG: hypothetical protein M3Y62_08360 [Candidatus Dormibacteraeota bacterium]|nr:hypothetical protein [Candidatus Dormibacteraeota bacterium]
MAGAELTGELPDEGAQVAAPLIMLAWQGLALRFLAKARSAGRACLEVVLR